MTTEERLEKLEKELSRAKRRDLWLLVGVGLCLGTGLVAWAFGPLSQTYGPLPSPPDPGEVKFPTWPGMVRGSGRELTPLEADFLGIVAGIVDDIRQNTGSPAQAVANIDRVLGPNANPETRLAMARMIEGRIFMITQGIPADRSANNYITWLRKAAGRLREGRPASERR